MTALTLEQYAPGDPVRILQLKDRLHTTAQRAEDAQRELQAVLDGRKQIDWDGDHVRAFERSTEPLPGDLGLMASSYFRAAHALRVYAERLDEIQRQVRAAIERARDAERRRSAAERARDQASVRLSSLGGQQRAVSAELAAARAAAAAASATPEGAAAAQAAELAAASAQRRLDEINRQISLTTAERNRQIVLVDRANSDYDRELGRLARERSEREEAELRCSLMLREAVEHGLRDLSWWEQVTNFAGDAVKGVALGPLAWFSPSGLLNPGMFAGAVLLGETLTDGTLGVLELGIRGGGQAWRSGWGFLRADLGLRAPFIGGVANFFSAATAVIGGAEAAGTQYVTDIDRPQGVRTARAAGAGIAVGAFEFGVSKGFITGGAALGTAVMPGVGTVVGGVIGFAAGELVKAAADEHVQAAGAWAGELLWDAGSGVVRGARDVGSALAGGARDITEAADDVLDGAANLVGNVGENLRFW